MLMQKPKNKLSFEFLNAPSDFDKFDSKTDKNSSKSKNNSTLSLHIAAYENSVEATGVAFEKGCLGKNKSSLQHVKNLALSNNNNPFEFPRQQTDDKTNPAIMQFTASQKLLNPNLNPSNAVRSRLRSAAPSAAGELSVADFERAFQNTPPENIQNVKDLRQRLQDLNNFLTDSNKDWSQKSKMLISLRGCLIAENIPQIGDVVMKNSGLWERCLIDGLKEGRSALTREYCFTIAFFAIKLGGRLIRQVELMINNLMNLVQSSAKVMSSSGIILCEYIARYVHHGQLIKLTSGFLVSKASVVRRSAVHMFDVMLSSWGQDILELHLNVITKVIKNGLNDRDLSCRSTSRDTYFAFSEKFPNQGRELYDSLDTIRQRALNDQQRSAASSTNALENEKDSLHLNSLKVSGPGATQLKAENKDKGGDDVESADNFRQEYGTQDKGEQKFDEKVLSNLDDNVTEEEHKNQLEKAEPQNEKSEAGGPAVKLHVQHSNLIEKDLSLVDQIAGTDSCIETQLEKAQPQNEKSEAGGPVVKLHVQHSNLIEKDLSLVDQIAGTDSCIETQLEKAQPQNEKSEAGGPAVKLHVQHSNLIEKDLSLVDQIAGKDSCIETELREPEPEFAKKSKDGGAEVEGHMQFSNHNQSIFAQTSYPLNAGVNWRSGNIHGLESPSENYGHRPPTENMEGGYGIPSRRNFSGTNESMFAQTSYPLNAGVNWRSGNIHGLELQTEIYGRRPPHENMERGHGIPSRRNFSGTNESMFAQTSYPLNAGVNWRSGNIHGLELPTEIYGRRPPNENMEGGYGIPSRRNFSGTNESMFAQTSYPLNAGVNWRSGNIHGLELPTEIYGRRPPNENMERGHGIPSRRNFSGPTESMFAQTSWNSSVNRDESNSTANTSLGDELVDLDLRKKKAQKLKKAVEETAKIEAEARKMLEDSKKGN